MRLLDRALGGFQRLLTLGPSTRPPAPDAIPAHPGRRPARTSVQTVLAVSAAVIVPIAFGAALIPIRSHLSQSISLLIVLPVLTVALLAGARLATIAALAAATAFDIFHTQPYYQPTIDDPDDIVETVVLLAIGITTGYLARAAQRAVIASRVRRHELAAITDFLDHIGRPISNAELAEHARRSIERLLNAHDCEWNPNYGGTVSPVLKPDGTLTNYPAGHSASPPPNGGTLPTWIEIPIGTHPHQRGRFVVHTSSRTSVSLEERRAAATVATTLGRCIKS